MHEKITQTQIDEAVARVKTEDFSVYPWCRNCEWWDCYEGKKLLIGPAHWIERDGSKGDCTNPDSEYFLKKLGYCTRSWMKCDKFKRKEVDDPSAHE